jgi:quercetin dioxygenase-like cupin family protein
MFIAACACVVLAPAATLAADASHDAQGMEAQVLMKTTTAADDSAVTLPQTDKPEITAVLITIQPGGHSNLHQHPVPPIVYVLEGGLETEIAGVTRTYQAGQALVEPLNTNMQAFNRGQEPTKLLVIFVGEEGKPTSVDAH